MSKPICFCVICRAPLYCVPISEKFRVCGAFCKDKLAEVGLKHLQSAAETSAKKEDPTILPQNIFVIEWAECSQELGGIWFPTYEGACKYASYWGPRIIRGIREFKIGGMRKHKDHPEMRP